MTITFEDIEIGHRVVTARRTITEADILWFCGLSGDFNPLRTPTGGLRSELDAWRIVAYVDCRRRFLAPVYAGDTTHGVYVVTEVRASRSRTGTGVVTCEVETLNQADEARGASGARPQDARRDPSRDMPGYRTADYEFLARLDTHYLLKGAAGRPGPPFGRPSLIVAGRQDSRVGYRGPLSLVEEFPRATVAVLDLGGHHVGRIERPELLGALMDDWLARMSGPSARSGW